MDKKAKDILFKTYWTSTGWTDNGNRHTNPEDLAYAREKGLMFDPLTITKSELIFLLSKVLQEIRLTKITDAFLCSLTNKRLDWRSGLGSYANAKRLLNNTSVPDREFGFGEEQDLNVLNFERIKWGGVRHFLGLYNWLDMTLLNKEEIPTPADEDIKIFRSILQVINNAAPGDSPSHLRDNLKDVFKASKDERDVLMEILSCADILKPLRHDRKEPGKHDWHFVLHWRGEDKYDKENVRLYFGKYGIE